MFEISVKTHFSAAHRLRDYPGDCARWHGHNWEVTALLQVAELDDIGIAVDFRIVKDCLKAVMSELDHSDLNSNPEFADLNPTSEVIARYLFGRLSKQLNDGNIKISRVTVSESPGTAASYFEH